MRSYLLYLLVLTSFSLSAQLSFSDESSTLFHQSTNSGAPMGVADMNGDGLDDIVRLDGTTTPVLDYQEASGNFTGFSFPQLNGTQWSMSVADVDKNGFNDIFTGGAYNTLKLLKANAAGSDFTLSIISNLPIFLQGSNFADIDNDGNIDIFACHDDGLSHAYRNTGSGNYDYDPSLINTSSTVPSDNSGNYGTLWTDYDSDGDLDLYLSKCRLGVGNPNDGRRLNMLFENDGNGNYSDVAEEVGLLPHGQSWAADFADIDNDGDLDCFIINHDISCNLYINDGTNHYSDQIEASGMLAALNAAGGGIQCKFVDFDNDGFVDLLFSSRANNHLLFKNDGDLTFTNVSANIPTSDRIQSFATGDLNNDGFIDFIAGFATGYNSPSAINDKLYLNDGNNNHFFNVRLDGVDSNENGVGARLELYGSWGKQIREIRAGESYGITTSLTAHFGLGTATSIDSLIIRWPSGYIDKLDDINIDENILVEEGSNCVAEAEFSYTSTGLTFNFTDESSSGATSWFWTFGDGNSSTAQNPNHTYAQDDNYLVCLFINGDCGQDQICKEIATDCVTPTAAFGFSTNALTANFTGIITGTATSLDWSFGDGNTSTGIGNPAHTYAAPGTYTVCFEVSSSCGNAEVCHEVTVACASPGVGFEATISGLTINFTDNSDDEVTQWLWSFGDGNTSTEENPSHTYAGPGVYTICLTGTSVCGSNQVCLQLTINCTLPSVGFNAQISSLTINFTDNSDNNVTQWLWDFGDGNTSTEENPSHTYTNPGTYTICLTGTSACGSSQVCIPITVNCSLPQVGFNAQISSLTINFTDDSAPEVTQWLWDFGDGNTSTAENPSHTYANPGTYTICLTGTSACGSSQVCIPITVNCSLPQVGFNAQISSLTINFTDDSAPEVTQWLWDFGDGNTSTEENPSHTYANPGTYTICLTGTSACGSSQVCIPITVNCSLPSIGFQTQTASLTTIFTNTSSPDANEWLWDFGDGTTATEEHPTHTFPASGTYTVCLTGTSTCGSSQVCLPITVNCTLPSVGFQTQIAGLSTNFTDNSSADVTQWLWDFGDGNTSNEENPSHTYATPGTYTVCLTGTSTCGSSQVCLPIMVNCAAPVASFQAQVNQNLITLTDASSQNPTQWFWTFGDGASSTEQNPSHEYALAGNYTICLTATSVCGTNQLCLGVTIDCISPTAGFNYQTAELTVTFADNSSSLVESWFWTFGDGGTSTAENPTHTFATGNIYTVCLTVTNECGSQQICQDVAVNCPAPQALFNTLTNTYTTTFTDISMNNPTTWSWNFGDGNTSTLQNPVHTYAQAGTYTTCLTVTSACGENSYCLPILIVCDIPGTAFAYENNNLVTNFTDNTTNQPTSWSWNFGDGNTANAQNPIHTYTVPGTYTVCLTATNVCGNTQSCQQVVITCNAPVTDFASQNTGLFSNFTDNSSNNPSAWLWTFGDGGTSTIQNPSHIYASPGTYTVCLTASSICGSSQTCQTIMTSCTAPVAAFGFQSTELSINFNDNSTNQPTSWLWTFGDGETSTLQNPSHIYAFPGTYMVCLTASSVCGTNQICQQITTNCTPPSVGFSAQIMELNVTFSDNSAPETTQWAWDFGDGNHSTEENPIHLFSAPGTYTVCLTATSICGSTQACTPITVNCAPPSVGFSSQVNQLTLIFTDASAADVNEWLWTFGDGETATTQSPTHTYTNPGTYTICLTGTSMCGTSQVCQTVMVNCAAPLVVFESEIAQLTANFTDNSAAEVTQWLWDFGDGASTTLQNPSHIYENAGTYTVCLTGTSICGSTQVCQEITVSCITTIAGFSNETTDLSVDFTDSSTNQPNQWVWNFGDGATSTEQHPSHIFGIAGTYTVCLLATNDCGFNQVCQNITVSCDEPVAGFETNITNLTVNLTDISSNSPSEWLWTFGDGETSAAQNPTHQYNEAGQFTICLSVMNACGFTQSCETITVNCTAPEALFSVNGSSLIQSFTDASTESPTQWLWVFGDGETSTVQNPNHTYQDGGTYNVCLTVTNDCGTNTACQLILLTTATEDLTLNVEMGLSPNPANEQIRLSITSGETLDAKVFILNIYGQQIGEEQNWQVTEFENELFLTIAELPAGLYFVAFATNEGQIVKRFLKIK